MAEIEKRKVIELICWSSVI